MQSIDFFKIIETSYELKVLYEKASLDCIFYLY